MGNIVMQALGTCGLAASIMEFIYVWTNRDSFTNFEEVFFLTAGSLEMLGEVVFLISGLIIASKNSWSVEILKTLIQDPVHILASAGGGILSGDGAETVDEDIFLCSDWAFVISLLSALPWAVFFPVWGPSFEEQGRLRLALSISSLVLLLFPSLIICFGEMISLEIKKRAMNIISSFCLCALYAMEKVFEVFIILSEADRLMADDLGWWLVGFQVIEIFSVALFFGRFTYHASVTRTMDVPRRNGPAPSPIIILYV